MESAERPRQVPPGRAPTFGDLVASYVKHGDRDYLARLLQIWSPAIDQNHTLMGDALHQAVFKGDDIAVRMILDAGLSPMVESQETKYTPLLTAAAAGQREIARLLWQVVGPDGRSTPYRALPVVFGWLPIKATQTWSPTFLTCGTAGPWTRRVEALTSHSGNAV
ncbi:hypothetical protein VTK56DRAFT_5805 [Thermocarpiscus australiensis]